MINAYRQLAEQCDYPLHLGVTEAGPAFQGTIKSAVAFGALLAEGIGDTIRVSLSAPPVEEVKVGNQILESLGLRSAAWRSCPARPAAAPRSTSTRWPSRSPPGSRASPCPLRVAVMGCVVNGPGEAREADLGVASGNGKGQIFVRGEVIKTVPESQIVETLIEEAMRIAEEMEAAGVASGEPAVSVELGRAREMRREEEGDVLRTSSLRVLRPEDLDAVTEVLACWPATRWPTCSSRRGCRRSGLDPARLGGEMWGYVVDGQLRGALLRRRQPGPRRGGSRGGPRPSPTGPAGRAGAARRSSARATRSRRCGSCSSRPGGRPARCAPDQPLMAIEHAVAGAPPTRWSAGCARTSSTCCCRPAWRCSPRRSASRPSRADGGAAYRGRVAELIRSRPVRSPASRTAGSCSRPRSAR